MSSSNLIRWGGLAAMLGGIVGILYFPFHAVAYFATEDGATSADPAWVAAWSEAFRSIFEPLFTFASPDDAYMTYGKIVAFVIVGFLAGIVALHARQAAYGGRLERWGFRITFVSAFLLFLGSIGEYWVGALEFSFFAFAVPGFLLSMVGYPLFGIGTLKAKVAPRLGGWLLAIGAFPGIILMSILTGHLSGGLLLLDLAWVVTGYALYSEANASAKRPARVAA